MNFGPNFNNRKLFTGELTSKLRTNNVNQLKNRMGARSIDDIRMARIKLKDQLNGNNTYGSSNRESIKRESNIKKNKVSNNERQFNHIEAIQNIKRGL